MLSEEFLDFAHRKIDVPVKQLFPNLNLEKIRQQFWRFNVKNFHQTVYAVARELWNGHYGAILSEHGFWDSTYAKFSGHCHQCTPVLGLVLHALGFDVSYLECFRIREHFLQTGRIEQVPPSEEPNPAMKEEFCSIKRIPYCCLEVMIDGQPYYMTSKHLKPQGECAVALLTPVCYRDFVGVFHHQDNPSKSGIYLQPISRNPVVWMKQTAKDPSPELFATFLRIKLI